MNIWKILGIEETKDKMLLKKAYREKLVSVNPEDDPEGFMTLRGAYEEALRLADEDDAIEDNSTDTLLTKEIRKIYDDFSLRIDVDVWKSLFDRDEFVSLDSEAEAFDELMRFLMEHVFVPQKIWHLIVEQFDIQARRRELAERYPDNFISYMINNAQYDDIIDYYMFHGDLKDVDSYIQTYYELDRALRQNQFDKAKEIIDSLDEFGSMNPYLDFARLKYGTRSLSARFEEEVRELPEEELHQIALKDKFPVELSELYEEARMLLIDMPEDINLLHICGDLALAMGEKEEAKQYFDLTLKLYPDNYFVKAKQAEFAYVMEQYKESRDQYLDLLKENHYDNNVRIGMIKANQKLIEYHQKILLDDPENIESKMEIAWSYYQSYQFQQGIEMLESFEPNEEKKHEYVNVKGRTYLCLAEYEKALEYFKLWKQYIEELPQDDNSEEIVKKRKRYEYVNFLIADCYLKLDSYEEASDYLERALEKEHDEIILSFEAKCELEYKQGNYEACIKACDVLQERDDKDYIGYDYRAKAFFEMNYFKEAFDASQHAIALYPYVPDPYILQIKIFCKINQIDNAFEVLKRFDALKMHSDKIEFYRARVLDLENRTDEALNCMKLCVENTSIEETDMEHFEELYMLLAHLLDTKQQYKEAIDVYNRVLEINPEHPTVYGDIAENYKSLRDYQKALMFYEKQIKRGENPYFYLQTGIIHRFLENYKAALESFEHVIQLDSKNFYAHSRIGLILEKHGDFKNALQKYNQALELIEKDNIKPYGEILSFKARCLQCLNLFKDAAEVYDLYINAIGLNADIAYDYSELLMRMEQYQKAVSILRKCIDELEYNDELQACIRQLIDVYGHMGYVDLAHETLEVALNKNPEDYRACAILADMFYHMGEYDKAKAYYIKATELDKNHVENYHSDILDCMSHKFFNDKSELHFHEEQANKVQEHLYSPRWYIKLAQLYRCTKRYKEAKETAKKAIQMKRCTNCFYSKCHEAYAEYGFLCIAMRDYDLARQFFEEAIKICGHNSYYDEILKRIKKK